MAWSQLSVTAELGATSRLSGHSTFKPPRQYLCCIAGSCSSYLAHNTHTHYLFMILVTCKWSKVVVKLVIFQLSLIIFFPHQKANQIIYWQKLPIFQQWKLIYIFGSKLYWRNCLTDWYFLLKSAESVHTMSNLSMKSMNYNKIDEEKALVCHQGWSNPSSIVLVNNGTDELTRWPNCAFGQKWVCLKETMLTLLMNVISRLLYIWIGIYFKCCTAHDDTFYALMSVV